LKGIDIRIAHPVWPLQVKEAANAALARLCAQARQMAFEREWGTVTVASLLQHVHPLATPRQAGIDVVEPVAAAAELLPSLDNIVRLCAVVDVGAGTTDIGLFLSLVPDDSSSVRTKLYPTGQPVSVFKAGNLIDSIVLNLLESRAHKPSASALADVRARIRGVKETLFQDGYVQELGCDVHLNDVQDHPDAKAMAAEIRTELERVVRSNAGKVADWMSKPVHSVNRLELVMAGGGGSIDFLLKAVDRPFHVGGKTLNVKVIVPGNRAGVNTFGASRGRMAVALGGASSEYDSLMHEEPKLTTIRRGAL
jgi:molecular chaperone HscA